MLYINRKENVGAKAVALDDMILTADLPTTAGSKMLENFTSLFEAEVVTKLKAAGCDIAGKTNVGEFGIDFIGETSYFGAVTEDGKLTSAPAALIKAGEVGAVVCLDANGAPRRAAALADLVFVKPTYGTVSRHGVISAACSGDTVGVMAKDATSAKDVLAAIMGHDDKDGTSLPAEKCALADGKIAKVAVVKSLTEKADADAQAKIADVKAKLAASGVEVTEIDADVLLAAKTAWAICMSAELCNNVSRYDGVKYGYRSANYTNIDELYTNSRTEAFGELAKYTILYGSETLSTENYMPVYDKALRIRRVIVEALNAIFADVDAILLPACAKTAYTEADVADVTAVFDEAAFTAVASLTGMPAVAAAGVQFVGKAFSEGALLDLVAAL